MHKIKTIISSQRFLTFEKHCNNDSDALTFYLWDIALSQSLYPALHILEISLRNKIHQTASTLYKKQDWYQDVVKQQDQKALSKAEKDVKKKYKPVTPDQIVASLSFGFWTTLFNAPYEDFVRSILKDAFPKMPKQNRTRINISKRLNQLRYLRNRIFHYEPIFNKTYLKKRHDEIIETINWIEPNMMIIFEKVDNFKCVYNTGVTKFKI